MFGKLLCFLPSIALGTLRFRFRQPAAPSPAPMLAAQPAVLPNGTDVHLGGIDFEVYHVPQFRPTVEPGRMNNEMPVRSPTEEQYEELGPTPTPPRDCVRTPGISNCGCKGMISACHEESYLCEVGVDDLKKELPNVLRDNYQSKFAHPLLNTLQFNSTLWRRPSVAPQCLKCFQDIAATWPHNEQDTFLQMFSRREEPVKTYQPEETGWRIYSGSPDPSAVMSGICNAQEMQGLEECLTFFWTCDANRKRLQNWVLNTNSETKYIDAHPGTRPGVY